MLASRVEAVVYEHAPRFSVSVEELAGAITIMLNHPASIGTTLVLRHVEEWSEERFVQWIHKNPEIQRIRQAPDPVPHPHLCLRVYNASQALGWDDATLGEVTGMLAEAGAITEDERDWLRSTSGAY